MKNKLQKTTTKLTRQLTLLIMTLLLTVGAAQAADYTVNSTNDPGVGGCDATECTLREAIAAANATAVDDVINFAIPTTDAGYDSTTGIYTITLSGTQLEIQNNGSLTINGTGADKLTVSGNRKSGVFKIHYLATAEIKNLTISDGAASSGGGIFNGGGTVTLTDSTVSGNSTSGFGGGIYNFKSGGSSSSGTLTLTNSTVSGNTTPRNGGGIYHESGIFTLTNSTVSGNSAGYGSGIYNRGNARIINSTISGNSVGISNFTGTLTLINSIIANSTSSDCNNQYGTVNASYSLIEDGRCITEGVNNNLKGDPMLGPLQDNGGPTETHALLKGSPAIDKGSNALIPSGIEYDQRGEGYPRIFNGAVDLGSFEVQEVWVNDSDGDGIDDTIDNCPNTANPYQEDNDMDMIGDVCDPDDDNDGQLDADEITCGSDPLDANSTSPDNDGDNSPDCVDTDDDDDGVLDVNDAFPFDPTESVDTDGDGIGNNADTDDDGDLQSDADEVECGSDPLDASSVSPDADGDNIPDCVDPDDDNDGVIDSIDLCSGTVLPEPAPSGGLKKNRFIANADGQFVDGEGTFSGYTIEDTRGCAGSQIIERDGLGRGHDRFGITRSAIENWIAILPQE